MGKDARESKTTYNQGTSEEEADVFETTESQLEGLEFLLGEYVLSISLFIASITTSTDEVGEWRQEVGHHFGRVIKSVLAV